MPNKKLVPLIPILRKLGACEEGIANLKHRKFATFADLWIGLNDENARTHRFSPGWDDLVWLLLALSERTGVFSRARILECDDVADQAFTKDHGNVFRAELAKRGITRQRVEQALLDLA